MSEPDNALRNWQFYVEDMIGFCERIRDYTAGLDKAAVPELLVALRKLLETAGEERG